MRTIVLVFAFALAAGCATTQKPDPGTVGFAKRATHRPTPQPVRSMTNYPEQVRVAHGY